MYRLRIQRSLKIMDIKKQQTNYFLMKKKKKCSFIIGLNCTYKIQIYALSRGISHYGNPHGTPYILVN